MSFHINLSLKHEMDMMKSLDHPNILKLYETIQTDLHFFFVMEYIENGSLTEVLKRFGLFPEPLVSLYTKQVLSGLEYLHSNNIVHRGMYLSLLLIAALEHVGVLY
jgi:serine/threonine protein kinase